MVALEPLQRARLARRRRSAPDAGLRRQSRRLRARRAVAHGAPARGGAPLRRARPAPTERAELRDLLCAAAALARRLRAVHGAGRALLGGATGATGPPALAGREPARAARGAQPSTPSEIAFWRFVPVVLRHANGCALKAYANERGVAIVGDLPIFVAHHSAEVLGAARPVRARRRTASRPWWPACRPTSSATTGQRWGNPLYRWDRMAAEGYAWWIARVQRALRAGRHRSHRPLPRLRRLLGDPGQRARLRSTAAGWPGRARRCSMRSRRRSGRCRSSPRTWA